MTTAGAVRDVLVGAPPREWWQVWAERRAGWWERHPGLKRRLSVVRTVGLWLALVYLLVVVLVMPELLLGMRAYLGACLVAVVWFFAARTKTVTWSGFMRFFAVCGAWSVVIALVLAWVSSTLGNAGVEALGPTTFVAGLGEEALKLVPLVVVALAAPRRVSRFAAVDFWLLGLAAGLAFELVEEGARRVFLLTEMQRQGLLQEYQELYGAGVPEGMVRFGLLPTELSNEGAVFAGHAVSTGTVAALAGLAVVAWRACRGRGAAGWAWRAVAVMVPAVCLVTMMADHLAFNAHRDDGVLAGDGAWLDPDVSAVPWWLRVPWQVFGHGHHRIVWFVLLFFVCLAVDGYRLGTRPASSLAGQPLPPGLAGALARLWVLPGRWARLWAAVATAVLVTGYIVVRDAGQVTAAHVRGAGEPVRAAMRRGAVAASTARALRETAMDHAAGPVRPARTRLVAAALLVGLLAVALVLAPHLAAGTGPGMLRPDTTWLPSVLESLAEYWNSLPLARQIAIELALGAMFALVMGPIGWGVAGVLTWGLSHGAGVVTFARDPRAAVADYLANLTPAQLAADGLDLLLTFAPGNFATGSRAIARNLAHSAAATPLAVVATRRNLIDHGLPAHPPPPPPAHPSAHPSAGPTHPPTGPSHTQTGTPSASPTHPQAGPTPNHPPTSPGHAVPAQTPTPDLSHPPTGPTHSPAGPTSAQPHLAAAQPPPLSAHPDAPAAPTVRSAHPVDPTPAPAGTRGDLPTSPAAASHAGHQGATAPTGPRRPSETPGVPTAHPADSPAPSTRPADQPATATPRSADQAPTARPDAPATAHDPSDAPAVPSRQDPTIAMGPVRPDAPRPPTDPQVQPRSQSPAEVTPQPRGDAPGSGHGGEPPDSSPGTGAGPSAPRQRTGDTVPSDGIGMATGESHTTMRGYQVEAPTPADLQRLDQLAATPGSGVARHADGTYRLTDTVEVHFDVDGYFARHPEIDPDALYSPGVTYRQEYLRQLDLQETGMNDLTVAEWRHNVRGYGPPSSAETAAHTAAREAAGGVPRDGTALLHGPDRIAGGRPNTWDGLGHRGTNSSIGRQWKDNIDGLEQAVDAVTENLPELDPELLRFIRMNVRLSPG